LHRFRDTATYWQKIAYHIPLSHSAPSLSMFPLEFLSEVNREENIESWGYPAVKTAWSYIYSHSEFWHDIPEVMDGQTVWRTESLCIMHSKLWSGVDLDITFTVHACSCRNNLVQKGPRLHQNTHFN